MTVTARDGDGNVAATVATSGLAPGVYSLKLEGDDLTQYAGIIVRAGGRPR